MFGDTLTMTLGGLGGTARVLKKINQDNYASEYLERTSTDELRCKIRHTVESAKAGTDPLERHNVELTRVIFGTAPDPDEKQVVSLTIRNSNDADAGALSNLVTAIGYFADATNNAKLQGWES